MIISRTNLQVDQIRVNDRIKAAEVRLITNDGQQLGVVPIKKALEEAERRNLDLVEVAGNAAPPVCRIMNYGKYRYEQTKREREARSNSHQIKTKEIKFRPSIGEHDLENKTDQIKEFLEDGNRVKVTCFHKGREAIHQELGVELLKKIVEELKTLGTIEIPVKKIGASYQVVFGPSRAKNTKKTTDK